LYLHRVVGLDHTGAHLWGRVDRELELGLLAIVGRKTLHEEGTETGSGSTAEGVEDKEALETGTVVGETTDLLENGVDELLADGVVTTGVWRVSGDSPDFRPNLQLLAASSLPVMRVSGWKRDR
jgi:hypothetical protein